MEIPANSDAALVSLFLSFALVDDVLHPKEMEVIRQVCKELSIPPDVVSNVFHNYVPDGEFASSCKRAMANITDETLQNKAFITLCDIAAADDVFHKNERLFLSLAFEQWSVEAAASLDEFEWDDQQREVVEAPEFARLEVDAGPGMGKTAVACSRVSKLIEAGVEPTNIWLLSFTRTAVQEIRERIELFAEESHSVLGVKIGTIDSRAWRIRLGFSEGEVEKLFGSYDASILSVIDLIDNSPREIREFLESLEHVIIDEAQDITGVRARLLLRMLKLLPSRCGVTIFVDPAQAIYGFTTDGEDVLEEDRVNLIDLLEEDFNPEFVRKELRTIHRTDVPNLIELIEDLRLDIYVNEDIDAEAFNRRREVILEKANERVDQFDAKELVKFQNALVLFRRRSEVLMASSFANSEGIPHRIRMSGLPQIIEPWLGQLLSNFSDTTIDKNEFIKLWDKQEYFLLTEGTDVEEAWNLLAVLGQKNGAVHISEVRKKLARTPPDINASIPDLGTSGPIIGTIHASKGREANEVVLRLPEVKHKKSSGATLDEESRVMFVGATRAKSKLYVGNGFVRAQFAPSLESGRCFMKTKASSPPAAQVEIGRQTDIDPFSFVSKKYHTQEDDVSQIQRQLASMAQNAPVELGARLVPAHNFNYQIWTTFDGDNPAIPIGYFNGSLNQDLFQILNRIAKYPDTFRPPNSIPHFYLMGVTCFAVSEDDPQLMDVHEPYASTGIWLVPVIIGFPKVTFMTKNRARRQW
ncbi:MAG: AAA family ATPase [Halieaceae bacterium]|nr:AAA family ATPase [Halieaceae bacterium]